MGHQLGSPARPHTRRTANLLNHLRLSMRDGAMDSVRQATADLAAAGVPTALERFITGTTVRPEGHGFVYVLSTREQPEILKIGHTGRDVAERVREINAATGVLTPYGARGAWSVPRTREVEAAVHALLAPHRIPVRPRVPPHAVP